MMIIVQRWKFAIFGQKSPEGSWGFKINFVAFPYVRAKCCKLVIHEHMSYFFKSRSGFFYSNPLFLHPKSTFSCVAKLLCLSIAFQGLKSCHMPILGYILRLFISVRWPKSIFELLIDCTKLKSFTVVVLFEKSKNVTSMHNKILIIHRMYTVDICNLIHNSTSKEGFISIFQRFNIQETILVSVTNSRYRFNLYENPPNDLTRHSLLQCKVAWALFP